MPNCINNQCKLISLVFIAIYISYYKVSCVNTVNPEYSIAVNAFHLKHEKRTIFYHEADKMSGFLTWSLPLAIVFSNIRQVYKLYLPN